MSSIRVNAVLRYAGAFLIAGGLFSTPVFAQGTAVITGTVVDASTKRPIADVAVTATSPGLQGERVVVTDATGLYRIPQLPSGVYTVRFEKESYRPFQRPNINIRQDVTVRVNIDLLPEAITTEIEVVGKPPTIDIGSTTTGANVSSEFIHNIAVVNPAARGGAARSFESLAVVAPGAQTDLYGVSISGTTSNENQYLVDGVSVNDPGFGLNATPLTVDFVSEVNIITGGYLPEYGRATGGVMSVVTKSGSNEFHGSVFGNMSPGATNGDLDACADSDGTGWLGHWNCGLRTVIAAQTINTRERLWNLGDFGAELGGPIMKDKLWFFAGFAPSYTRDLLERTLRVQQVSGGAIVRDASGIPVTTEIPGSLSRYFADQSTYQYMGKLTYLINQDHNISLSVYGTPTSSGGPGKFQISSQTGVAGVSNITGTLDSLSRQTIANSLDLSAKLSSSFMDKRLLLDVSFGWHNQQYASLPYDGTAVGSTTGLAGTNGVVWRSSTRGPYPLAYFEDLTGTAATACEAASTDPATVKTAGLCPVSSYQTGGPGFLEDAKYNRYQGKAILTYLLTAAGHHVFKGGIDIESAEMDNTRAYAGGALYRTSTRWGAANLGFRPGLGGPDYYSEYRGYGEMTAPDQENIFNSLRHVSSSVSTGGFLQDSWNVLDLVTLNAGVRYDSQAMYARDLISNTTINVLNMGNQWSPRIGLIYDFTGAGRSKLYVNYARYFENAVLDMIDRGFPYGEPSIGSLRNSNPNAGTGVACNPNDPTSAKTTCRTQASLEIPRLAGLGAGYGLPNPETLSQFGATFGDEGVAVDSNLAPQSSDEFVAGGEYEVFPDARAGITYTKRYMLSVIEDMSLDEANTYLISNPGRPGTVGASFPLAQRDYDAVTLSLNKNFSDLWLGQISYTWSSLYGNYAGLFRPETGQLDPNINSTFDLISLLTNATGPLPGDRTHVIKAYGAKEFVFGPASVNLGVSYTARSGAALSVYGAHEVYGADEAFILPRGSYGRLPWTHNFDGHLAVNYRLTKDSTASLSLDVFNIFNFQQVIGRDQRFTLSAMAPIKNGTPLSIANPSTLTDVYGDPIVPWANFMHVTAYQAARSLRFGARVTF